MDLQVEQDAPVIADVDSASQTDALLDWLGRRDGIASVAIVLRPDAEAREELRALPDGDPAIAPLARRASHAAIAPIRERWRELIGRTTHWSQVHAYPTIGACSVRGPADKLRQLFDSRIAHDAAGPMHGFLYGGPLSTPESLANEDGFAADETELKDIIASFARECYEIGRRGGDVTQIGEICRSEIVMAAAFGSWGRKRDDGRRNPFEESAQLRETNDYVNRLGIGDADRWGLAAGYGQTICVIDSGATRVILVYSSRSDTTCVMTCTVMRKKRTPAWIMPVTARRSPLGSPGVACRGPSCRTVYRE